MAVIELFVTECIKSVLKIVEGIVEGFAKRTDRLRKHAYRLVEGLSLLDEDIAKLLDLINEAEKSGDKHFLDRFEPTVSRTRRVAPVESTRIDTILNDIMETLEGLEVSTDVIRMRYSVYKNFHDIKMMKRFIWSESFLLSALRHSGIGSRTDRVPRTRELSPEKVQEALMEIRTVCVALRARIAAFIRDNYKITDLPSGR